jgi:hypothetical protein
LLPGTHPLTTSTAAPIQTCTRCNAATHCPTTSLVTSPSINRIASTKRALEHLLLQTNAAVVAAAAARDQPSTAICHHHYYRAYPIASEQPPSCRLPRKTLPSEVLVFVVVIVIGSANLCTTSLISCLHCRHCHCHCTLTPATPMVAATI